MSLNDFKSFINAQEAKETLEKFTKITETLPIDIQYTKEVYFHLKNKYKGAHTQLWNILDQKLNNKDYINENANKLTKIKPLIIGCGPAGLRTAIECALLGSKVTLIDKREEFTRNNVLLLWDYSVCELKSFAAKVFYPKFCVGGLHHISIRKLQLILLKVALLFGVRILLNSSFSSFIHPSSPFIHINNNNNNDHNNNDDDNIDKNDQKGGENKKWYGVYKKEGKEEKEEFNCIVGADGLNSLVGRHFQYEKKCKKSNLAIGITFNFINRNSKEENLNEFGIAKYLRKEWFDSLYEKYKINLENCTYYRDETHYYVCTATKESLLSRSVFIEDKKNAKELLEGKNINKEELLRYARDVARHCGLPDHIPFFTVEKTASPDIQIFDFTKKHYATNQIKLSLPPSFSSFPSLSSFVLNQPINSPSLSFPSSSSSSPISSPYSSPLSSPRDHPFISDNDHLFIDNNDNNNNNNNDDDNNEISDDIEENKIEIRKEEIGKRMREEVVFSCLVGDALLEPFWPLGTGANRAFLSSLDAVYSLTLFSQFLSKYQLNNDNNNDNNENNDQMEEMIKEMTWIEDNHKEYYNQLYKSDSNNLKKTVVKSGSKYQEETSPYALCGREPFSRYKIDNRINFINALDAHRSLSFSLKFAIPPKVC